MNIKWLKVFFLILGAHLLISCGGVSDPPRLDAAPEVTTSFVPLTQGLTQVSALDYNRINQSGSWRVTLTNAKLELDPDYGIAKDLLEQTSYFHQLSLLDSRVNSALFAPCNGFDSTLPLTFQASVEQFDVNINDIDELFCPAGTPTSREIFQSDNTVEFRFLCDNKINAVTKIERVSELASIGLGQGEVFITDNAAQTTDKACATFEEFVLTFDELPDQFFIGQSASVIIPTEESTIIVDINSFDQESIGINNFIEEEPDDFSAKIINENFAFESLATSGIITLISFNKQ